MKQRKLEPAVQSLTYVLPDGQNTVDLSQCASLVNRRFYRQGINWVVAGFRFFRAGTSPLLEREYQFRSCPILGY
jgi:hypothetical protein